MNQKRIIACNSQKVPFLQNEEEGPLFEFFKLLFEVEKRRNKELEDVNPKYRDCPCQTE